MQSVFASAAAGTRLFEISWEVVNQVGGIYTVLRTKAQSIVEQFGNNYFLIGPYIPEKAVLEFEPITAASASRDAGFVCSALADELARGGCHFGRWLVPGEPLTILVDCSPKNNPDLQSRLDQEKKSLWSDFGISTIPPDPLTDEAICFGLRVADVVLQLVKAEGETGKENPALVHAHEWLSGVAILRLMQDPIAKGERSRIKTIFTTHATLIGRYEAGNNPHFYRGMNSINAEERARHYSITSRHGIERAAAVRSDLFTTVSEVTGKEAELFLGRAPDAILPNGLNAHRFTALHEFQNLHLRYKNRIHEFVMGHFFPSYSFDLDRTLYLFTSGRYEYRNKGMDIFIDALAVLRERLRKIPNAPTIVAFIVTKAETTNLKADALKGQLMFHDLKLVTEELNARIREQLLSSMLQRRLPTYEELLPSEAATRLKRASHAFSRPNAPAVVTHDLLSDASDPVLAHLAEKGFRNEEGDPVKIIFHPEFVTATSPLFGLDYDQFVRGCHLGVFPSYYEPWGYTPLECIALGIPTVTTDLSGFGGFVQETIPNAWEQGIMVLNRSSKEDREVVIDLATGLFQFCQLQRRQRIDLRNRAERLTETFDWSRLSEHYFAAYQRARKSGQKI